MARHHHIRRFFIVTVISLSLTALVTVLIAVANSDHLLRIAMMGRLCSDNVARRQVAVNYVVRQIRGKDPDNPKPLNDPQRLGTIAYARGMLAEADDVCFERIVQALAAAGVWGRDFGDAWVRYLILRTGGANEAQRGSIAVELGKLLWQGQADAEPRVVATIERLLGDESADVRLNALSAAAALPDPTIRLRLLKLAVDDSVPVIARHAGIMLALLKAGPMPTPPEMPKEPPEPPADAIAGVKRLAELESLPTKSADLPITANMPYLIRLQAVRVSRSAEPDDLIPVMQAEQPTLRDLAVQIALERFEQAELKPLALELLNGFEAGGRMSGAVLAGMLPHDGELVDVLQYRAEHATDWVVQQHQHLGLVMQGETVPGFEPTTLLLNRAMPPTTVTMSLLEIGRLEGLDWLLNPFGEPPVSLPLLLDQFRYHHVLKQYLPELPPFWVWAERPIQQFQVDVIRDWYLLRRPALDFDGQVFRVQGNG